MTARVVAIALAALLAGCAMVGPDYRRPDLDLPADYPSSAPRQTGAILGVPADWWQLYQDPLLNDLVAAGLESNADLAVAAARVEEAEAALREANAVFFPEIDGTAGASRSKLSTRTGAVPPSIPAIRSSYQLTATTTFELDFWGRLRRAAQAAREQYLATAYGRDVVALTLVAGMAQTYFAVRSLDAQILVSRQTLKATEESLELVRKRVEAGLVPELDLNQAAASRAQLAAQITELRRQRAVAVHQLGVLTGRPALQLDAGDLRALPAPPLPPPGLPSTLLERRPDLRQAEAQLASATALIGVARAAQFPTFSLTASLGRQSKELDDVFSSGAGLWGIGLNVLGPIFDAGRYAARTEQAEARALQAAAAYQKAARTAFREVSDALSNVRYAADAEVDTQDRVDQAAKSLELARLRYDAGYSAYLEVLDAQRTLNDAQLALLRNRQGFLAYTVDLMNALGGGWPAR